jgi:prepilin-type N-terminal cleavage/methylation domain-containing protein
LNPLRVAARDDRGFTMVELMVTVALLAVVMTAATGMLITFQRTVSTTTTRFDDLGSARVALNNIQQSLRTAVLLDPSHPNASAFLTATPDRVEFYANLDVTGPSGGPRLVRYERVGGEIRESVTYGTVSSGAFSPSGPAQTRVLARNATSTVPLFQYFDADADPLDPVSAGSSGVVSTAHRPLIRNVLVDVRVASRSADGPHGVDPTQLRNRVVVPNLYYKDEGQS